MRTRLLNSYVARLFTLALCAPPEPGAHGIQLRRQAETINVPAWTCPRLTAEQPRQKRLNPLPPTLADQKWWEVFQDEQLQQLIRTALKKQNYDVRIAADNILAAQRSWASLVRTSFHA